MTDELIPFFSPRYKGPTRSSRADIQGQSVLKAIGRSRKYLWVTSWDGGPDSVGGASFENARMSRLDDTDTMLKKLETFGKRATEHLFVEQASVVAARNA